MSKFPNDFDDESTLYTVHDSIQVRLAHDHHPGDTGVLIEGDNRLFPHTGFITLTDQCSRPEDRAVSFRYGRKTHEGFFDLELVSDSDSFKPRGHTIVAQNVMAEHHNAIKDAIIAIQRTLGIQNTVDNEPFGETVMGRVNFLQKLAFAPKAWFVADRTVGVVPFEVTFTSKSSGTDRGEVVYDWDFGDGTTAVAPEPTFTKTYMTPGRYTVTLTVTNAFGTDTVVFPDMIQARLQAPEEANILLRPQTGQALLGETLRTPTNALVVVEIPDDDDSYHRPGYSQAGEKLGDGGRPIDPIVNYTWNLADDLPHSNSKATRASWGVGGLYDITLRTETAFGAFRTTHLSQRVDVVDRANVWLWTYCGPNEVRTNEFGLLSETFKVRNTTTMHVRAESSFIPERFPRMRREFLRNNGLARMQGVSGLQGTAVLFWATGRDLGQPPSVEEIRFSEFAGFTDTYQASLQPVNRPWNWAALASPHDLYFILGARNERPFPSTSPTNNNKLTLSLDTMFLHNELLGLDSFEHGADALAENPAVFGDDGQPVDGHFSAYRTAWKGDVGYLLRNEGAGQFFRLQSFFRTEGNLGFPFQGMRKLTDLPGGIKTEGQLVTLASGIFFFNNGTNVYAYDDAGETWTVNGTALNNHGLRTCQDHRVAGFDNEDNTLLATSDYDRRAYLSFDYSNSAWMRFNEVDLTYTSLAYRPSGKQWLMGVY